MTLAGWFADFTDPVPFQMAVLDWLRNLGVPDPQDRLIRRVTLTAEGDGHAVLERCALGPDRRGPLRVFTELVPLRSLPPERPR